MIKPPHILALVPARAGSKGFPGKNLARLAGETLVHRAWRTLNGLRQIHPGLVLHLSTDSQEIADAWPEADRPRRLRPAHLAADDTPTGAVVAWELERLYEEDAGCAAVLLLQPTTPLISLSDLERLCTAWTDSVTGSAICARPAEHPPEWALRRNEHGYIERAFPHPGSLRRQDLPPAWMPIGVAMCDAGLVHTHGGMTIPGRSVLVEVPAERAIDIDSPGDLAWCEALLARAP